ncbi:MAG TPA: MFS transporter [Burkholderiales bacterium]|nr:MFS transporter [Burkholderiales bacterium]
MSNATHLTPAHIAARIERLPFSPWHVKVRVIMGVATFFDAFDALAIAYVLPVLIPLWKLAPAQIGLLISIGFAGQLVGAILFGWLAERFGRVRVATWTIGIFSVFSLVCALSWDYPSMLAFRFVQGLGLGGQVPIAAAYINEIAKAEKRGRFFLLYEVIFPVGLLAVALVATWVVPNLGWQWMFVIGALPALLATVMRRVLPESPRWLAAAGRMEEADRTLRAIEDEISARGAKPLPALPSSLPAIATAKASWRDLFSGIYLPRTLAVWVMWFCTYLIVYGISGWLPTIYRTIFKLPLQQALQYSLAATVAGLIGALACAYLIDRTGRRAWFVGAFFAGAVPLFVLWLRGTGNSASDVMIYASLSYAMINTLALGLYLYTPEIYPTRVRAVGSGAATAWLRVASMIGPFMIGAILPQAGLGIVFLVFGIAAAVGGAAALLTLETRGRVLEELSP